MLKCMIIYFNVTKPRSTVFVCQSAFTAAREVVMVNNQDVCNLHGRRSTPTHSQSAKIGAKNSLKLVCYIFLKFDMAIKLYYICIGLQTRDAFFGNMKQIHLHSPNLVDKFPTKVLLEAERRSGWMAVMLEMEVANQGMVYTYHAGDWNYWMACSGGLRPKHFFQSGDHIELEWDAIL
ncbi:hypothetical protein IW261DRAFT_1423999 [Armillaria novae-zelandiae]|uniref:Uncharacterized protein n=1 Tax=Armillaria novae-zelandiae TaxID=153914 RepID=A0AA39TXL3_9AGAR|nr:hypothetical protein IW261DRAFT_1423999 [Armillaria novae-zelandiae]